MDLGGILGRMAGLTFDHSMKLFVILLMLFSLEEYLAHQSSSSGSFLCLVGGLE